MQQYLRGLQDNVTFHKSRSSEEGNRDQSLQPARASALGTVVQQQPGEGEISQGFACKVRGTLIRQGSAVRPSDLRPQRRSLQPLCAAACLGSHRRTMERARSVPTVYKQSPVPGRRLPAGVGRVSPLQPGRRVGRCAGTARGELSGIRRAGKGRAALWSRGALWSATPAAMQSLTIRPVTRRLQPVGQLCRHFQAL